MHLYIKEKRCLLVSDTNFDVIRALPLIKFQGTVKNNQYKDVSQSFNTRVCERRKSLTSKSYFYPVECRALPSVFFPFLLFKKHLLNQIFSHFYSSCVCVSFLYLNIKIESKAIYMPAHTQYTWLSGSVLIWSTITTHTFNKIKYVTFDINKKKMCLNKICVCF